MKRYEVKTHLGTFTAYAATPRRAISNIRYHIFRRSPAARRYTPSWTVREA